MKTTIERITPAAAQAMLAQHLNPERQRKLSQSVVDGYARSMRAGDWLLTHQGIAIDDAGELIDGQHRLAAIAASGATVQMMVTRGIPHTKSANGTFAIDVIDRGEERGVGQQLQLRHGVKDANMVASVLRHVFILATWSRMGRLNNAGKFQVSFALRAMHHYGDEVDFCLQNRSKDYGVRHAPTLAASAFAIKACGEPAKQFYVALATGEGLHSGDPALMARRYLMQAAHRTTLGTLRVVLSCAMRHINNEKLAKVYDATTAGYTFFLEMQRKTVRKLLTECGFPETN